MKLPVEPDPLASFCYEPAPEEVERLIARAADHPDGTELLREGPLDAVAATFEVHAFVVDRARERLRGP
ncbi:MAG: hypothetical protein ACE5GW_02015 [Planctomycetota bacterium]